MYRLLEVGELIEKGDEYWSNEGWRRYQHEIGNPFVPGNCDHPSRRLVKPAVTPAALPDPGEGWRLLNEGETIIEGDEWYSARETWEESSHIGTTYTAADVRNEFFVRRRVAPVVSVGDRVKVLSGPWAGCTGVVIALDAYVLLSDYGKMTAKYDSTPVIELEHVRVGGHKLILNKVTVEPLPPVVPEVLYRDLAIGEVIRQGDEIRLRTRNDWEPAGLSEGSKIGSNSSDGSVFLFRRPVRLQSPGWRYLDAGETVQAEDDASFCSLEDTNMDHASWKPVTTCYRSKIGQPTTGDKYFRRKLPANQGN